MPWNSRPIVQRRHCSVVCSGVPQRRALRHSPRRPPRTSGSCSRRWMQPTLAAPSVVAISAALPVPMTPSSCSGSWSPPREAACCQSRTFPGSARSVARRTQRTSAMTIAPRPFVPCLPTVSRRSCSPLVVRPYATCAIALPPSARRGAAEPPRASARCAHRAARCWSGSGATRPKVRTRRGTSSPPMSPPKGWTWLDCGA